MEKQAIEDILVNYHDIFARHRMDIGMNTEFKVKLTPKDDKVEYSQSLPMPIHLKEDLIVKLALMHKYGIITVLPFSKYASPIVAQRKPSGKLRLLVDLRKINSLIPDDYISNNHPVSTLSDAAQHLAGKSLFCKLDCSQAYHCLHLADQRSVEMLAFNFARTFAYKRLVQGLSRSVSAFSSFMREYLDPVVKADQCAQYVDDIGIAANNATDLTRNIPAVFKCIRQAGLKLAIEKCHFGVRQVEFLGRTFSPEGISPQARKIQKFPNKHRFPKSEKGLQRYLCFVNYYRNYIPRMAEKLNPFYKLLKTEVPINITSELKKNIWFSQWSSQWCLWISIETTHSRKAARLNDGCQLQKCWICPNDRRQSWSENTVKAENVCPCGIWLKIFLPCTQDVHILKRFFGNLYGMYWVCTHFMGSDKANNRLDRQQVDHPLFPNKGNPTSTMECMWLCLTI